MMLLSTLLTTLFLPCLTSAFSFSLDTPKPAQCGSASITWTGGTGPYNLTIIPAFDYPTTISIPSSAYDSGKGAGTYSWTVNYPKDTSFVAMMSDSSGTGTGGVSPLYTVGSGSTSCGMRSQKTDFLFYLNETSLTQCDTIQIYWDASAHAPVTILGVIPGGQVFQPVPASAEARSLVWNTNVAAGTQVILAAFDQGPNGQGGSSALLKVGGSSDSTCLDDSSPSSTTAGGPTATGTKTGNAGGVKTVTAVTTETTVPKGAAGLSTGAIVGIVVSAVSVVLALQFALFWFCCRRQVKALIYHRREMRGQEVKPGGEVDLGLATRYSETEDDGQHDPRDPYASLAPGSRTYSISRSGDDQLDAASTVSPFIDSSTLPKFSGQYPYDLDPPRVPGTQSHHGRSDSLGPSLNDVDLTPSPTFTNGPFSSTSQLWSGYFPSSPNPSAGAGAGTDAGGSRPSMTKAQMAAALSASNPDPRDQASSGARGDATDGFGTSPPQEAPTGGFRRHEDAGSFSVEDLPPMYSDAWRDQQERDGDGDGDGRRDRDRS